MYTDGTSTAKGYDWRDDAACLDQDPELFFPIGNTGLAVPQIEEARAVCRRCDVVETCLRWALDTGQESGVWGGLSEDDRRALKRKSRRVVQSPKAQMPAGPTRALLEIALANGWTRYGIARHLGLHPETIGGILRPDQRSVLQSTADVIADADLSAEAAAERLVNF